MRQSLMQVLSQIRYTSLAPTTFLLRRIAEKAGVPLQEFVARNDMPCGSTIAPALSKLGFRAVDIGCVQLSMHSIRETAGSEDVGMLIKLFKSFFQHFQEVDASLKMDD
jgi:aspartyl aminopeptidase